MVEMESRNLPANEYGQMIDTEGGLDKIEELQNHRQNDIYEKACPNTNISIHCSKH